MKSGILKLGEKNKREMSKTTAVLEDIYITNESVKMITTGIA
jgi:hypothetical protein